MSGSDTTAAFSPGAAEASQSSASAFQPALSGVREEAAVEIRKPSEKVFREKFIPLTVTALVDRLTVASAWPKGEARATRRFFRYLDYWRRQQYSASLVDLLQTYEPFSPDSDLLVTRDYSPEERIVMQKRVVSQMEDLLVQANYERIDPSAVELIMTKDSTYGLDLHVDFTAFEECLICLLSRCDHSEGLPAAPSEVLSKGGIRQPDLSATVSAFQTETVRDPRAGGDG